MEEILTSYRTLLLEALDKVTQPYYRIATTYEPTGIVRERVFCYELYYHIRCLQELRGDTRLSLNGEIDKRGHVRFQKEDRKNPDFVFHIPGEMDGNTIVVEVKGNIEGRYQEKAIKDINTLILFVEKYRYQEGVFLVYNYSYEEVCFHLRDVLRDELAGLSDVTKDRIHIFSKKAPHIPTETRLLRDML